jgi:hypothetical protein
MGMESPGAHIKAKFGKSPSKYKEYEPEDGRGSNAAPARSTKTRIIGYSGEKIEIRSC